VAKAQHSMAPAAMRRSDGEVDMLAGVRRKDVFII
jgi:hypothetical protein